MVSLLANRRVRDKIAKPKVKSVLPKTGQNNADMPVTIIGQNFTNVCTVENAINVTFVSSTKLTAAYPKLMKPGKYDVVVKAGRSKSKISKGFEVKIGPPFSCFTAGGQIYLEWDSSGYTNPKKFHIFRDGSKIDTVNKGDNKTSARKDYYVDIQSEDGKSYKYKIQAEDARGKKEESTETASIAVNVFDNTQDSELHFFADDDTKTDSIDGDHLIAKFSSGKLSTWCIIKTYMCKESDGFLIYSVDPAHKSTGGKKNEIDEVLKKSDGDSGAGTVPHKKGIHTCDTTVFGAEHKTDKKTSMLLLPIKGGTLGFFWSVHEKAPPNKKMSEVSGKTKIGTSNRKIIWVKSSGLSNSTYSTIAHEFQHLIYYGHDEDSKKGVTWLNEGLSVYSVDLNNYWTGNSTYEKRLGYFLGVYKDKYELSTLRLTDAEWGSSPNTQYAYALSGMWTLYLARRFPKKIKDYGKAKADHESDVFKQATVSSDVNDTFSNIFAEWALANHFNKIVVAKEKASKPITILSDNINDFSTDLEAGKYNYYHQVENDDVKDGGNELKIPNTPKIRELELKIPNGTILAGTKKEKPKTPFTPLEILKGSIGYLRFPVNATASDDKRLHIFVRMTGDVVKMYTVEEGFDNKTCFTNQTLPTGDKKILFSSHNNQKEVVAILPNHTNSKITVHYMAYISEKPKIEKIIYSQSGSTDKEVLARDKDNTTELDNGTETTIKIIFDQAMMKDTDGNGNYVFKDGDTLEKIAEKYYGSGGKKDKIVAPNDPPTLGDLLELPLKVWYTYEGDGKENEITSFSWSKTSKDNDTLTVKCTPDTKKKDKKITLHIGGAANFGKDLMAVENKYNFKIKVTSPTFEADVKKK